MIFYAKIRRFSKLVTQIEEVTAEAFEILTKGNEVNEGRCVEESQFPHCYLR